GTIERAAADGSGPKVGARVVGFLPEGAWAERVAVPTHALAELPANVTFSQAATCPVAGRTALHALGKNGTILGKRVLVTGATGGVGDFAVQLARLGGAPPPPRGPGGGQGAAGRARGGALGWALGALERAGVCVTLGVSASAEVTFDAREFFVAGRTTLYGFYVFTEVGHEAPAGRLPRRAELVAAGQLMPHI